LCAFLYHHYCFSHTSLFQQINDADDDDDDGGCVGTCLARGGGGSSFVWSHMCGGTMRPSAEGPQIQRVRLYLGKRTKSSTSSGGGSNMELASVCQQPPTLTSSAQHAPPLPPATSNVHH